MWMRRKTNTIANWINTAACGLTADAASRVRDETQEHFQSALDEALKQGASETHAHRAALASLGDPREANRKYRGVHVTAVEQRLYREDQWVAHVICSRPYLLAIPFLLLAAGIAGFIVKPSYETATMAIGGAGMCFVLGAPFVLSINTLWRGRVYRAIRWAWLVGVMWLAFGADNTRGSWAQFVAIGGSTLWIVAWAEWNRASMRRKIPVEQWPRGLYL